MRIKHTRHIGFFILPTIQWQPTYHAFGMHLGWSFVFWWGHWGLALESTP